LLWKNKCNVIKNSPSGLLPGGIIYTKEFLTVVMNEKNKLLDAELCAKCSLGPPAWQYKCQDCDHEFEMPAPKGPSEERNRACPACKSRNLKVINIHKSEACAPGG
jgi:DNA-directed RNA polymerase subunit RPC12/RpoP